MNSYREPLADEQAKAVIDGLRAAVPALAGTLDGSRPVVVRRRDDLEAYPGVEFFAVSVTISHRPVTHVCARAAGRIVRLADSGSVEKLNELVGLELRSPDAAAAYLRAWFVLTGPATEWLIERADQIQPTDAAARDAALAAVAEQAASLVHPPNVTQTGQGDFRAVVTVMRQQTLTNRILSVSAGGSVTEVSSSDLLTGVPIPFVAR